jgi:hypothetical protein
MGEQQADYDSPWKEALERYFTEFIAFFFPQAHGGIEWARGHEFLDKELQQVTPDATLGPRRVDKLVKVWRPGGDEAWVLVHVEVQSQAETGFAERMYVYHYRLFDRYHRRVASLAVLGDEQAGWRPERFDYELWGCQVGFRFPSVKLLDYQQRWLSLEVSDNPFATVVMAHLRAQETRGDAQERKRWKVYLIRRLYERGYSRRDVIYLFRFIDWVLRLPEEVEEMVWQEVREYEEETHKPYVTSVERIGFKKGIEQGLQQGMQQGMQQGIRQGLLAGIELGLKLKFDGEGLRILPEIYKIEDVDVLRAVHEGIEAVDTVDDLRRIYA